MRKLLSIMLCLLCINLFAQEDLSPVFNKAKELGFIFESKNKISFVKVIQTQQPKTQKELFDIAEAYFTYNYGKGDFVIQTKNLEQYYIIGKGVYSKFFNFTTYKLIGVGSKYDAEHILRIDCKDSKIRVIITIPRFISHNYNSDGYTSTHDTYLYQTRYPFNAPEKPNKISKLEKEDLELFKALLVKIEKHFKKIEEAVNNGNSALGNQDW